MALRFLLALVLVLYATAGWAAGGYARELKLVRSGHSNQAYQDLRPKLLGSAGNPEFDTAFGMAALDSGATAEAVAALERVLAVQPTNLPARTELARAYEKLGDTAAAARELEVVKSNPATPARVKANLSHYASVLEESLSGGPMTVNADVSVNVGYDSNINTATTSNYLVVPALAALGPARVANGAQAEGSAFAQVNGNITLRQPLSMSTAVFGSVGAQQKTAFANRDYDQTTVNVEGGVQYATPDDGLFTLGVSGQEFWFGGEDYTRTLGLGATWKRELDKASNLTVYGTASHIDYVANDTLDANRGVVGLTVDRNFGGALGTYGFAGVYGGTEQTEDGSADAFSYTLTGVMAGVEVFPAEGISVFGDVRYELRSYEADYPMFLEAREDRQLDVSVGAGYALTGNWALRPTLAYRYAQSNIGFYDYSRWLAQIGLRYRFP